MKLILKTIGIVTIFLSSFSLEAKPPKSLEFSYEAALDNAAALTVEKAIQARYITNERLINFLRIIIYYHPSVINELLRNIIDVGPTKFSKDLISTFAKPESDQETGFVLKTFFLLFYYALKQLNKTQKGKEALNLVALHDYLNDINIGKINLFTTFYSISSMLCNGYYILKSKGN